MKTTKYFLSMAALALVGAVMTGCSSEDNLAGNQQPAVKDNIVTVTTTIGLGGGDATTRALSATGVKTFAEGDELALFYSNTNEDEVKAVATAENISADGKSATFTFTLTNPQSGSDISLCYPAAFMNKVLLEVSPAFAQDGTLNGGVKANDLGFAMRELDGTDLPASISLTNYFAVVAFTLKDGKGTAETTDDEDITSTITEMTIELPVYEYTYTITREAALGPIYVVLNPTDNTDEINITATGGGKTYTKSYTKGYMMGNFYQQGLLMTEQLTYPIALSAVTNDYIGSVVTTDGNVYATVDDATAASKTAAAKIAYVSGTGHGLALALEDMSTTLTWDNSGTNNDGKTAAEWCSAWNTSTPVTGATWLLPSQEDWANMMSAEGLGLSNLGLQVEVEYWSSTEDKYDTGKALYYDTDSGSWYGDDKDSYYLVRACLVF